MGKQKNTELNFLYQDEKNKDKKKRKKQYKGKEKSKQIEKRADKISAQNNEKFNFDNEIVIGVTRIPKENVKQNSKKRKVNDTNSKKIANNQQTNKSNKKKTKKTVKSKNRNAIIVKGIIKWTTLLIALAISIIFFMMSPLFNVAEIEIQGCEKIAEDTIISLSQLKLGENIYQISNKQIKKNIKENSYIQQVDIKRKLPNKIIISIQERKPTYMLEYANSFAYINNQGYILEISQEKLEVPIIIGYETKDEEIKEGNRLCDTDLSRLEMVLKIVESANSNGIGNCITRINIQDKQSYILMLEEEKKIVYLGDASNLSNRMLYLKAILTEEKGAEGEIFVDGDLNKEKAYFRMKE